MNVCKKDELNLDKPTNRNTPNVELDGYETAFRQWLESADNFHAFKQRVTKELLRLGFSEWSYSRIDYPRQSLAGTVAKKSTKKYTQGPCYNDEQVYRQALASKPPAYRPTTDKYTNNSPMDADIVIHHKSLSQKYSGPGQQDQLFIPLYTKDHKNHAFFTLARDQESVETFQKNIHINSEKLRILVKNFEDIGIKNFSEHFLGSKKRFEKLVNGKPIRLLNTMFKHDLKVYQAAEKLNMSRDSADKHLAWIREHFGVSTTLGALREAIRLGLISA